MNKPNPFVPQGSLLEQQSRRRSRLKLGVFCVLAVGIVGLSVMLIQGCKREETDNGNQPQAENNQPQIDTNNVEETTNQPPPLETSNAPVPPPPTGEQAPPPTTSVTPAPIVPPAAPQPPAESEYVVVQGDTFSKIAKENGITVKALEDANPDVQPTRLRIGQKLVVPAAANGNTAGETANGIATSTGGDEVYTVKAGDNLTKIAHRYGVTVKALEAENNLSTTRIKVGQKLNIPAKAEASPAPVNAPPATTTAPETAPTSAPPAQSNPPSGQ